MIMTKKDHTDPELLRSGLGRPFQTLECRKNKGESECKLKLETQTSQESLEHTLQNESSRRRVAGDMAGTGNDFSCDIKDKMGKRHTGDTDTSEIKSYQPPGGRKQSKIKQKDLKCFNSKNEKIKKLNFQVASKLIENLSGPEETTDQNKEPHRPPRGRLSLDQHHH